MDNPDEDVPLRELRGRFDDLMAEWQSSTCRNELLDIIIQHQPQGGFDKVVCLGTGRFSERETDNDEDPLPASVRRNSNKTHLAQLVCAVDVAAELGSGRQGGNAAVQVLAQEPFYEARDLELLTSQGVTVLPWDWDRKGLNVAMDHIGPRTLLFELYVFKDDRTARDFFGTDAALYVCTPVDSFGESIASGWKRLMRGLRQESRQSIVTKFKQKHDGCGVPYDTEVEKALFGLHVYWPKKRESDGQEGESEG